MVVKNFPTVGLYFRFHGDSFDPDEITRRLGIQPTTKFRHGDPITADGQGRRRGYGWILRVGPRETLDIEDMLEEFRERVNVPPEAGFLAWAVEMGAAVNVDVIL